jgi:hypothetical protein
MSESDHKDAENHGGPAPGVSPALPTIPGVSTEMLQVFQLMQQQTTVTLNTLERRAERRAQKQVEENAAAMKINN